MSGKDMRKLMEALNPDPMADEDDYGIMDDIGRTSSSDMLPTNVSYSIKLMAGDEDYDDEYLVWRHKGGTTSSIGQDITSMEDAETLIADNAKNTGVGRNYKVNYR